MYTNNGGLHSTSLLVGDLHRLINNVFFRVLLYFVI